MTANGEAPQEKPRGLDPQGSLNLGLVLYIAIALIYGLPMLLWPSFLWDTIGGAEGDALAALESLRWVGALLTALAVGAVMVLVRPRGQRSYVTMMAIHLSLAGIALLYSAAAGEFDDIVDAWFYWLGVLVVLAAAVVVWGGRWRAREILGE